MPHAVSTVCCDAPCIRDSSYGILQEGPQLGVNATRTFLNDATRLIDPTPPRTLYGPTYALSGLDYTPEATPQNRHRYRHRHSEQTGTGTGTGGTGAGTGGGAWWCGADFVNLSSGCLGRFF